ncbi:hypothetical protein [Metabacillus sp. Hm71]|uniref:hypothetical protein n=1 Tax=Metabacillus sp. Hm71 TaxID=3450743 RepID=UPI003F42D2CA
MKIVKELAPTLWIFAACYCLFNFNSIEHIVFACTMCIYSFLSLILNEIRGFGNKKKI